MACPSTGAIHRRLTGCVRILIWSTQSNTWTKPLPYALTASARAVDLSLAALTTNAGLPRLASDCTNRGISDGLGEKNREPKLQTSVGRLTRFWKEYRGGKTHQTKITLLAPYSSRALSRYVTSCSPPGVTSGPTDNV